jgi:tetratricopeptide (TPR) repeat protein
MPVQRRSLLFAALARALWAQGLAGTAQEPETGRRRALVIGNKAYPQNPLLNPVNDALDMQAALRALGFTVEIRADAPLAKLREAAQTLARSLKPSDVGLFYFSGHGMQIDGRNLLAPVDFTARTETTAREACLEFDDVQDRLERSPAALSILIMDACRNNPFLRTRSWARGLALVEARLGSYVAFAASPGQTASDNVEERNGLFTKYVLAKLKDPLPLSALFREVRRLVYESSERTQLPYLHDQLVADFHFHLQAEAQSAGRSGSTPAAGLLSQGQQAYARGDCGAAFELLDRAVRQDPENPHAQNAAGLALVCLGRHSQALKRFHMAISLKPDFAAAYRSRGMSYMKDGKYDLAIEDFDWAIEREPLNSGHCTLRGWAHLLQRQYPKAQEDFGRSIALNPSDALAFHGRGLVAHRMGRYREALSDLMEARARNSRLPGLQEDIARAQARAQAR